MIQATKQQQLIQSERMPLLQPEISQQHDQWHPVLDGGFRLFFIGAALQAIIATIAWLLLLQRGGEWLVMPPLLWHGHEMLFGYTLAIICGFLLTAVHNWTGIDTVRGWPLLSLFLLWFAGRIAVLLPLPLMVAAMFDLLFLLWLSWIVTRPVVRAVQWQQAGVLGKLYLLWPAELLFYWWLESGWHEGAELALQASLYLIIGLLFNMGRRVIPFFIEKGVGVPVTVRNRTWVDRANMLLFILFAIADLGGERQIAGLLAIPLLLVNLVRLYDWHSPLIWQRPMLWVLYLGYGWTLVAFLLYILSIPFTLPGSIALHAFTLGAIGMVTIGMAARVTLGHTGRNVLSPPGGTSAIFGLVMASALVRQMPALIPESTLLWYALSQLLWISALALFLWLFGPILYRRNLDWRESLRLRG